MHTPRPGATPTRRTPANPVQDFDAAAHLPDTRRIHKLPDPGCPNELTQKVRDKSPFRTSELLPEPATLP